ncbi:MAG: hypothetical protein MUF18_04130 [Fimbriiglobus sp.]|nr:hypothetical protein [Fimbriiglobus sp.]
MRRFSRSLLALVLTTAVAATTRAAEVEPLLPKDTEQVVHMNFKQMLDSDIMKKYAMGQLKQALQGEDIKKVLETLGLDPLKDIERATMGIWTKEADTNVLGVIKGKFDTKKLYEGAKAFSADSQAKMELLTESVDGKDVTLVKMTGDNGKPGYLTVADESTILVGTEKKIAIDALASFNKKEKAKLSKELTALLLKQDDKASMYLAAVTEGKLKDIPEESLEALSNIGLDPKKLKGQLEKMSTVSVTLNMGKEVKLAAVMGMKDADAAEDFNGTLDKLVETAKVFLPLAVNRFPQGKTMIDDLTKTLGVKTKDKDVTLSLSLTAQAIGDLAGKDE